MYPHERSLVKRLENKPFALLGVNSDRDREALKNRADRTPEAQAKEAEKLRQESEEFFVRATDKFGDVQLGRSTVGEQAKVELYELRFLSIGKVAPEVEGEDADSKKFKLSDYRGKVVLIDFWGNW